MLICAAAEYTRKVYHNSSILRLSKLAEHHPRQIKYWW